MQRPCAPIALTVGLVLMLGAATASARSAKPVLPMIPADVEMLVHVDLVTARKAPSFGALQGKVNASLASTVARAKAAGVDPDRDIDASWAARHPKHGWILVAEGRFPVASWKQNTALTVKQHEGTSYWQDGDLAIAAVGSRLVIAEGGQMPAVIDAIAGRVPSLATGKGSAASLRAAIQRVGSKVPVWVVGSKAAFPQIPSMMVPGLRVVAAAVTPGAGLQVELSLGFASAKQAEAFHARAVEMLPQMQQAASKAGLTTAGASIAMQLDRSRVITKGALTAAELASMLAAM